MSSLLAAVKTSSPQHVLSRVGRAVGGTRFDITGGARNRKVVRGRIACYWALRQQGYSLPAIGRLMGGRHHTTVLHGLRLVHVSHLRILKKALEAQP